MFKYIMKKLRCQGGFAAITGTKQLVTQLATKVISIITATLTSASDTITLTQASHGISSIDFVTAVNTAGVDAALLPGFQISYSGLVITIVTVEQDGTASTDWTSATIRMMVIGDN